MRLLTFSALAIHKSVAAAVLSILTSTKSNAFPTLSRSFLRVDFLDLDLVFFLCLLEPDLPDLKLLEPVLDLPEEEVVFFFLCLVVLLPLNLILIPAELA